MSGYEYTVYVVTVKKYIRGWIDCPELTRVFSTESEADEYSDKYENMHEYGETKVVECTLVDNGLE